MTVCSHVRLLILVKSCIRVSGTGGQGIISTGIVLGHAAVAEGLEVVQTQSFGAESRGGAARSDVIVSDQPIYELGLTELTHFIALAPSAWLKYQNMLSDDAFILVESEKVEIATGSFYGAPFMQWSLEKFNNPLFANMIILGTFAKLTGIFSLESMEMGILQGLPRFHDQNIAAVRYGYTNDEKVPLFEISETSVGS